MTTEIEPRAEQQIAPGIHFDVPFKPYLALNACSSSRLKDLGRSPSYCRYRIDNSRPSTAAMAVGSLVDCLLLEPEREADTFAVKDFDARTNVGKARRDELAESGITVLSEPDYQKSRDIVARVQAHPFWKSLTNVRAQVTAIGGGFHGRKARPDILAERHGAEILVDLKVNRKASQDVYPRACWGLWHPQQLAWYREVLRECGHNVAQCWILAVHSDAPHETTAYQMSDPMMAAATKIVLGREERYAECDADGVWPDGDDTVMVDQPEWMMDDEVLVEVEGD